MCNSLETSDKKLFVDSSNNYALVKVESNVDCGTGGGGPSYPIYGTTWTYQDLVPNITISEFAMSDNGQYQIVRGSYFSEPDATTYLTDDFGATWDMDYYPIDSVSMSSNGQYQLLAGLYKVSFSDDFGVSWDELPYNGGHFSSGVSPNGQRGWYVFLAGNEMRYTEDYGQNWGLRTLPITIDNIVFSSNGQYLLAVSGDKMYRSNDYGQTWVDTALEADYWRNPSISADGSCQISLGPDDPYISRDNGITWNLLPLTGAYAFSMSENGQYMTAIKDSVLYLSSDKGQTWNMTDVTGELGLPVSMSSNGRYMTVATGGLWVGPPTNWTSGNLYTSDDYGQTWNMRVSNDSWIALYTSPDGRYRLAGTASDRLYYSDH